MIPHVLASLLASRALGHLTDRVAPNRYAPTLVDQGAIAAQQAGGLRGGTSGLAGSERDYYEDPQGSFSIGYLDAIQDVTSWLRPPAQFLAGDPGRDDGDATTLADFRSAPVRLDANPWGVNQRGSPHVLTTRINPPGVKDPLPREVAAARAAGAPQGDHDAFDGLYDG
jgi:hypothetical protein